MINWDYFPLKAFMAKQNLQRWFLGGHWVHHLPRLPAFWLKTSFLSTSVSLSLSIDFQAASIWIWFSSNTRISRTMPGIWQLLHKYLKGEIHFSQKWKGTGILGPLLDPGSAWRSRWLQRGGGGRWLVVHSGSKPLIFKDFRLGRNQCGAQARNKSMDQGASAPAAPP